MNTTRGRVTIADVAREAGVSVQTVSRVLNGKGEVSSRTRERVRATIAQLGYRPNSVARSLVTRRTTTLGLVVPDIANPFFPEVARGVEDVAHAAGYHVFLCNTNEQVEREEQALISLIEKRVDGIILCSARLPEEQLAPLLPEFPAAVLINRRLSHLSIDTVLVEDEAAVSHLVYLLRQRGYRRFAFLAGPPASYSAQARRRGFLRALTEAGEEAQLVDLLDCAPSIQGGLEATQSLLRRSDPPEAIVCYNDLIALGALAACQAAGLSVPSDIAVTGFDDIPIARLVSPPLTTIRVPKRTLGELATQMLLEQLSGRQEPRQITLHPELVRRGSALL